MRILQILTLCLALSCVGFQKANAQDDPEYRMEVGASAGMMNYMGDFNRSVFSGSNQAPVVSLMLRRVFNPYSALRFALGMGKLKGESKDMQTFYPDFNTGAYNESARENYKFSNALYDLTATYEYNFQPYGTGRDYRGAKRFTPYIAIGLGLSLANSKAGTVDLADYSQPQTDNLYGSPEFSGSKNVFTMQFPIGFGVKYKVSDRVNLGVEWMMHFTISDKLDGVKDPYRISSSGLFKNTDAYSNLQISLTYSFWEKCRTCNKD